MSGFQLLVRSRPPKRRGADRRGSVRIAPAQEIVCYCTIPSLETSERARVCDISSGGACLLLKQRVEVGDLLLVELINNAHTYLCLRGLRVVRVFTGSGDESVIAGEFDRRLGYEEILPFIP